MDGTVCDVMILMRVSSPLQRAVGMNKRLVGTVKLVAFPSNHDNEFPPAKNHSKQRRNLQFLQITHPIADSMLHAHALAGIVAFIQDRRWHQICRLVVLLARGGKFPRQN